MPKRVPMRLCLGCSARRPKRELVRVVRTPDGAVAVDPTGKRSGRGAYVCPDVACLEAAARKKRLEAALEAPVGDELLAALASAVTAPRPRPPKIHRLYKDDA